MEVEGEALKRRALIGPLKAQGALLAAVLGWAVVFDWWAAAQTPPMVITTQPTGGVSAPPACFPGMPVDELCVAPDGGLLWGGPQISTGHQSCRSDMPCGLSPEAALRQAYQYCETTLKQDCGGLMCLHVEDTTGRVVTTPKYADPACDGIAERWESSAWKKADDAADAKMRQRAIDHARAFVEAVEKSK